MRKRKAIRLLMLALPIALLGYWIYPKHTATLTYHDPKIYGMVNNEETARKIAEAIWLPIFGEIIYKSEPFIAILHDSTWTVKGTLHTDSGGTPYIEISKTDARIIQVTHGK